MAAGLLRLQSDQRLRRFLLPNVRPTGRELGTGSYGTVEEVNVDGLVCAGKKIHDALVEAGDPNISERYVDECQLMSDLRHPHLVQFLGHRRRKRGGCGGCSPPKHGTQGARPPANKKSELFWDWERGNVRDIFSDLASLLGSGMAQRHIQAFFSPAPRKKSDWSPNTASLTQYYKLACRTWMIYCLVSFPDF